MVVFCNGLSISFLWSMSVLKGRGKAPFGNMLAGYASLSCSSVNRGRQVRPACGKTRQSVLQVDLSSQTRRSGSSVMLVGQVRLSSSDRLSDQVRRSSMSARSAVQV